jgi:hypothetical protein
VQQLLRLAVHTRHLHVHRHVRGSWQHACRFRSSSLSLESRRSNTAALAFRLASVCGRVSFRQTKQDLSCMLRPVWGSGPVACTQPRSTERNQ